MGYLHPVFLLPPLKPTRFAHTILLLIRGNLSMRMNVRSMLLALLLFTTFGLSIVFGANLALLKVPEAQTHRANLVSPPQQLRSNQTNAARQPLFVQFQLPNAIRLISNQYQQMIRVWRLLQSSIFEQIKSDCSWILNKNFARHFVPPKLPVSL